MVGVHLLLREWYIVALLQVQVLLALLSPLQPVSRFPVELHLRGH